MPQFTKRLTYNIVQLGNALQGDVFCFIIPHLKIVSRDWLT